MEGYCLIRGRIITIVTPGRSKAPDVFTGASALIGASGRMIFCLHSRVVRFWLVLVPALVVASFGGLDNPPCSCLEMWSHTIDGSEYHKLDSFRYEY